MLPERTAIFLITSMAGIFIRIGSGLAVAEKAVDHFFADAAEIDKALHAFSPPARAAAAKIFADLLAVIADAPAAVGASGMSFALDAKVVSDLEQLVSDARSGVKAAVQVFEALGMAVPQPAAPKAQ